MSMKCCWSANRHSASFSVTHKQTLAWARSFNSFGLAASVYVSLVMTVAWMHAEVDVYMTSNAVLCMGRGSSEGKTSSTLGQGVNLSMPHALTATWLSGQTSESSVCFFGLKKTFTGSTKTSASICQSAFSLHRVAFQQILKLLLMYLTLHLTVQQTFLC